MRDMGNSGYEVLYALVANLEGRRIVLAEAWLTPEQADITEARIKDLSPSYSVEPKSVE